MSKISFLAQFPPPIHGLSKAVETLYRSNLHDKYSFSQIDISNNKAILRSVLSILASDCNLFYFTISQTKWGNLRDLFFLRLIRLRKKKCIIHLHGGYYRTLIDEFLPTWQKKLNYDFISKVDACIVLSESLQKNFQGMIENDKIFMVPNCVDNEFLLEKEQLDIKLKKDFLTQPLKVLYLSNFIETKGYKEVLELAKMAKENNANMFFRFAGKFYDEKDRAYFDSFVAKNKLNDYVSYLGIVKGEDKQELLSDSHVFILLTRYPNEGQPISILEALANGQTIITTNHAGIPDMVQSTNGLIVDKVNIDLNVIYPFLNSLLLDKTLIHQYGVVNYNAAIQLYTEAKYINNMDFVFSKVLANE